MQPKVSIIVPVYNTAEYLDECIKSILNQTYRDFELILVDDGSSDSSRDICKKYEIEDKRVRYVYKKNGGVSSARNEGLRLAVGEYIVFVDSDDVIKYELLENLLLRNTDFVVCGYEIYDDFKDTVIKRLECPEFNGSICNLAINYGAYISPPFILGPCFKLFKKELINKHNIVFPVDMECGEDAVFVLEYLLHCETFCSVSYIGYSYRKHGNQTLSTSFYKEKIDYEYRVHTAILSFLQKHNILDVAAANERFGEIFTGCTSMLICSDLLWLEKYKLFYEKFNLYKSNIGKPKTIAEKFVISAGTCKLFYPLIYLFKFRRFIRKVLKS